jgi:hypothetical protein
MDFFLVVFIILFMIYISDKKEVDDSIRQAAINKAVQFVEFQEEINQAKKQARKKYK